MTKLIGFFIKVVLTSAILVGMVGLVGYFSTLGYVSYGRLLGRNEASDLALQASDYAKRKLTDSLTSCQESLFQATVVSYIPHAPQITPQPTSSPLPTPKDLISPLPTDGPTDIPEDNSGEAQTP